MVFLKEPKVGIDRIPGSCDAFERGNIQHKDIDDWVILLILEGLMSGFPSCCVYQFAQERYMEQVADETMVMDYDDGEDGRWSFFSLTPRLGYEDDIEYVACLRCWKGFDKP